MFDQCFEVELPQGDLPDSLDVDDVRLSTKIIETIISDEFLAASSWEKKVTLSVKKARNVLVSFCLSRVHINVLCGCNYHVLYNLFVQELCLQHIPVSVTKHTTIWKYSCVKLVNNETDVFYPCPIRKKQKGRPQILFVCRMEAISERG
jgi:hypothetical protein